MASEASHGAGECTGLPQLCFETWPTQIIWLSVALIVLFWVLNRFALPKVAATLEERHNTIVNYLDEADSLHAKSEAAQAEYEEALRTARAEAQRIADRTRAEIQEQLNAAMAEADTVIDAKSAESATRLADIEAEAGAAAAAVAEETAVALVGRFAPDGGDTGAVRTAVAQYLSGKFGGAA